MDKKFTSLFSHLAESLKSSGMKEAGLEGHYKLDVEVNGRTKTQNIEFKQTAKHDLHGDKYVNKAYSWRPSSYADGRVFRTYKSLLEDNTERNLGGGVIEKRGFSTWVSNLAYQPDKFKTTTIMTCGCMGAATAEKREVALRDGSFSRGLNEFVIRGKHHEEITHGRLYIRDSSGYVAGSQYFRPDFFTKLHATREKLGHGVEISATTVSQNLQEFHSASISRKNGNKTTITTDYVYSGKTSSRSGHEVREITQFDASHSVAVTKLVEKNYKGEISGSNNRSVKATEIDGQHQETVEISGYSQKRHVNIRGSGTSSKL